MAIVIIGSNLNQYGNAGQFETDPSTWGYSTDYTHIKSAAEHTAGLYSAELLAFGNDFSVPSIFSTFNGSILSFARLAINGSKKYIATAKIKTPSSAQLAPNLCYFKIESDLGSLFVNAISTVTKTVADAKDAWQTVQFQFDTNGSGLILPPADGTLMNLRLVLYANIPGTDHIAYGGTLFIDQFEIYEYEDAVIPVCTLAIDSAGTVVTDASGPLATDGSITLAITGGTGPFQYSKDDGATWQVSNFFAGLAHGAYAMKVMDADGCTSSLSISVNDATATFTFSVASTNETIAGASDGTMTITVIGTGGPFTFSVGIPVSFQSSNLYLHLNPGTYPVSVKDAAGNIVSYPITIFPGVILFDKIWFSRNPITYPSSAAPGWEALTNVRIFNEVTLNKNDDGIYASIPFKVDLPPDAAGNVIFYNREAFTDVLKAIPPTLNNNLIIRLKDRIKLFMNNTAQLQDDQVDPPGATSPSLPHLVILGGLGKFAAASMDYFGSYLRVNKKFMTWAPLIKTVDKMQEDYLNYFVFKQTTVILKLSIKAYYDDGTDQTSVATFPGVQYGQLYQIPAGPYNGNVRLINPAKNFIKYDLWMLDQDNAIISEIRTYIIDAFPHPRKRLFMFLNSLGSYEVLRFTGVASKSVAVSKTEVVKFLPYNYNALDGEFETNDVSIRESNSYSSGYIKDIDGAAWFDYLKDLLLGRRVFDVTDGQRRPIQIKGATFPMKQDQNFEYFVRFTADDAYEDENYTPQL